MSKIKFRNSILVLFFTLLITLQCVAIACTNATIEDLAKQGNTNSTIAGICNISVNDVKAILSNQRSSHGSGAGTGTNQTGFPAGTPVGQCGCWGTVNPAMQQPLTQCASGYAVPQACNAFCPGGGYMWRGVCG